MMTVRFFVMYQICFRKELYQTKENFLTLYKLKKTPNIFIIYIGVPKVNVTSTIQPIMLTFAEILTPTYKNISKRLDERKEILEETLSRNCLEISLNSTVLFTYSLLAFTVSI